MRNDGKRRKSEHINRYPAVNFHHATNMAGLQGTPLNWMVTINFGLVGVNSDRASLTLQKLIAQRFAPWFRKTAANDDHTPPTYVWALEAPSHSVNGHWLLHLPKGLDAQFRLRLIHWLEGLSGQLLPPRALHITPIYNLVGARHYALKGINPIWAKHLGVSARAQGVVVGKRSGFSRNLGPKARSRAGYRPGRHHY